jgi:hypothetical protein
MGCCHHNQSECNHHHISHDVAAGSGRRAELSTRSVTADLRVGGYIPLRSNQRQEILGEICFWVTSVRLG